jgi:hypothetical protein
MRWRSPLAADSQDAVTATVQGESQMSSYASLFGSGGELDDARVEVCP